MTVINKYVSHINALEVYNLNLRYTIGCKYLVSGYWGFDEHCREAPPKTALGKSPKSKKIFSVAYLQKVGTSSKTRRWKIQAKRE